MPHSNNASAKPKATSFRTWQKLLFLMAPWYIFFSYRLMKLMSSSSEAKFTRIQHSNGNTIPPPEIQVTELSGDKDKSWKSEDTKVLKSISLPRAGSKADIAQDDLLGDIWLERKAFTTKKAKWALHWSLRRSLSIGHLKINDSVTVDELQRW